jgi:hypothetical protein
MNKEQNAALEAERENCWTYWLGTDARTRAAFSSFDQFLLAWQARAQLAATDTAALLREIECLKSAVLVSQRSAVAISKELRAQLAAPAGVPDGWQLMPKKLTPEMRMAWDRSYGGWDTIYQVLLAAAPSPAKASEPVTKLCMGCVEQSSRIRELEHKMDYYKSAAPASDVVQVPRDSLEDELLEAIEEWALTEDQTINVGDVELEGHDTHIESTAGYTVRLVRQLRALLNGGRDE